MGRQAGLLLITSPPHCQTPLPIKPSSLKFHRFPLLYENFPFLISQIQAWQFYHRNHLKSMPFNPSTCGEKCSDRSQAGPKKHAVAQDLIIGYSIGSLSSRGSIALVFFFCKTKFGRRPNGWGSNRAPHPSPSYVSGCENAITSC